MEPVWREFCVYLFQLNLRASTGVSGQICHTVDQAERATHSQSASSLSRGEGTAVPAKQLHLLVHGMYHSTCIGKYPTQLACPLVAKANLISSEAVLPSGQGLLRSSALLKWPQYQEEQQLLKVMPKTLLNAGVGDETSIFWGPFCCSVVFFFLISVDNCQS